MRGSTGLRDRWRTRMRHGIKAALVPWMTTAESPYCQPAPAQDAEPLDGLRRIVRTGRMEPARGPEHRAQRPLVNPDEDDDEESHLSEISAARRPLEDSSRDSCSPRSSRASRGCCAALSAAHSGLRCARSPRDPPREARADADGTTPE